MQAKPGAGKGLHRAQEANMNGLQYKQRRKGMGLTLICLVLIGLGVAIQRDIIVLERWIPAHYLPWEPLQLEDPPGMVTGWKLSRLN